MCVTCTMRPGQLISWLIASTAYVTNFSTVQYLSKHVLICKVMAAQSTRCAFCHCWPVASAVQEDDRLARKVVHCCHRYGLRNAARTVCRQMGARCFQEGRPAAALQWFLEGGAAQTVCQWDC